MNDAKQIKLNALEKPSYYFGDYKSESSDCTCDAREDGDYCRCSKVTMTEVTKIFRKEIVAAVIPKEIYPTIFGYCVDRILQLCGIMHKLNWEVSVVGGYYGEETDGIVFNWEKLEAIRKHISKLSRMSKTKMMEYVLLQEYGYLLDDIGNRKWEVKEVDLADIRIGRADYYGQKLWQDIVEGYEDHELPVIVCLRKTEKINDEFRSVYRVIDGYHRLTAVPDKDGRVMVVFAK